MSNFNIVHNRLIEKKFKEIGKEEVEKLGFSLYENEKMRVLLKQLHADLKLENIQLYSNQIRNLLLEDSKNIYNTYLILCSNEDIKYEEFFLIERDNISLRKYVVRDEGDLNRIPFLDKTLDAIEKEQKSLKDIEYNKEVKLIFSLLENYKGKNINLKDNQIEEIVKTLMQGMDINEY